MVRAVDLVSYLPEYLSEFKEIGATLESENPEFVLVWEAADRVLKNEFIETADEYGIERFEKILNILPSKEDTLESRRSRVKARWFDMIPYTMKMLINKLTALCGDTDFIVTKDYQKYQIEIMTSLELFGQVEELEKIVAEMMPCNMIVCLQNKIICRASGETGAIGSVCCMEKGMITNDSNRNYKIQGAGAFRAGTVMAEIFEMKA